MNSDYMNLREDVGVQWERMIIAFLAEVMCSYEAHIAAMRDWEDEGGALGSH